MRRFVDLHLQPSIKDLTQVKTMVSLASELGYCLVSISLPPNVAEDQILRLRSICSEVKIDLAPRVDFTPRTPGELLRDLSRFRRSFEVVSVVCTSKAVARQAAKDRRVDILSFPAQSRRKRFFDQAEAELASKTSASVEIDMTPLISSRDFSRIRRLSNLRREVEIARNLGVPVTISSGATNRYLMRGPYEYSALALLFDMTTPLALSALSETPFTIVEKNRMKLSSNFVAPGIRVVRGKKCCPGT